jgi:hypothetical protein
LQSASTTTTPRATKPARSSKSSKAATTKAAANPKDKAATKAPTPLALYKTHITAIDKKFKALEKRYVLNPREGMSGVTSDDMAREMRKMIPPIKALSERSPVHAFNLMMYAAEHAFADLDGGMKRSGWGNAQNSYKVLDAAMIELVEKRVGVEGVGDVTLGCAEDKEKRETELEAYMRELGKKHPNKSERGRIARLRKQEFKEGVAARKKSRESAGVWVGTALKELVEKRENLKMYGIGEFYFRDPIEKLKRLRPGGETREVEVEGTIE